MVQHFIMSLIWKILIVPLNRERVLMIFKLSILFFERHKTHCPYLLRLTVLTLIVLDWLSNKFHHVLQVRNLKKKWKKYFVRIFFGSHGNFMGYL